MLVCLALISATPAGAHDFYLLPDSFVARPQSVIQVSFNNGDSFPASENYPIPARVRDARLLSAGSAPIDVQRIRIAGKRLLGSVTTGDLVGSALLVARTRPNLIVLSPDKFLAYLKEEGLTDVIAWRHDHHETRLPARERYSKYAKAILSGQGPDAFVTTAVGLPLEIVPTAAIDVAREQRTLTVEVRFKGYPAGGLPIEASWSNTQASKTLIVGHTDEAGRLTIPIDQDGLWRIHALKMERCADPEAADWESSWASLTFEVK